MTNRLASLVNENPDLPPEHRVIVDILKSISIHTKEYGTRIRGQCAIEMPSKVPVVVMYGSYPNGDYMCWFNDGANFKMFALVNENFKTVLECPNTDLAALQEALTQIGKEMDDANPPA